MSKKFLIDVLDKLAQVTVILVETSKIKEHLDDKTDDDENLKLILERTKVQVENLFENATCVRSLFFKQYDEISANLDALNEKEDVNKNTSEQVDPLNSEPNVINSTQDETVPVNNTTQSNKPLIKLVDINKLVEPSKLVKKESTTEKKNLAIDDTVVIITSSEDEAPKITRVVRRKAAQETIRKTRKALQVRSNSESSEDEIIKIKSLKVQNGSKKKVKTLDKITLSDTPSLSDSDTVSTKSSHSVNSKKKKCEEKEQNKQEEEQQKNGKDETEEPSWKKDPKFSSKCYVKILRVPCDKLKEYYLEKLELLEIKKLRDITSLKRKRKRSLSENSSGNDSRNSSKSKTKDLVKPARKEKDSEKSNSDSTDEDLGPEKGESTSPVLPANENAEIANQDVSEQLADDALNLLSSDVENDREDTPDSEPSSPHKENDEDALKEKESTSKVNSEDEQTSNIASKMDESEKDNADGEKENSDGEKENADGEKENADGEKENADGEKETEEKSEEEKNSTDDKETDKDKEKKAWKKDKLLRMRFSSSDSEEEFEKFRKKKEKMQEEVVSDDEPKLPKDKKKRLMKKRMKKAILSDSDSDNKKDSNDQQSSESSSSSESENDEAKDSETERPKPARKKRVKRVRDSSEEDDDDKSTRKQIRNIWGSDALAETTKKAEAEEKERKARIAEKQKKYNQIYETDSKLNAKVDKVVLDFDEKNNKELLKIHESLVEKLKPHQASGIQFMWDACFESLERAKSTVGSGCILAHCMGLGKTLQVIALSHTLLMNSEETKVRKVLVVSPLNTVLNWVNEFKQWLPDLDDFEVFELVSFKQNYERQYQVKTWHTHGGVLIIGYDMFRNLSNPDNKRLSKKMKSLFQEALVDPGPDLVICDEGHLLKNEKTNISIAMNRLKTLRRIVLTGTPLQNNLKEYFCMVQFIKPNLLGTYKEYLNRFVNPITNGQYTDSTLHDIQIMRKRSHVLHKMLDGVVQRRDYSVLQPYLPPKHEFVLFLSLTETQIKLYQHYMDHFARKTSDGTNRTSFLFVDFQSLQRICTHPRVLYNKSIEMKDAKDKLDDSEEEESEGSLKDFINDDEEESTSNSNSSSEGEHSKKTAARQRVTRATAALAKENGEEDVVVVSEEGPAEKYWWQQYCDGEELNNICHSSKLFLLFEILKECEQIGDKVLVFSQSLYSLNVIEYFLERIHDATQSDDLDSVAGYSGSWCLGLDYFRLDGSSSCDSRNIWCKTFNSPSNTRARLFLISTKAGGLGINLVAANRVIIFDVSWNPSHDIQSIYRVYRFGQSKPCYIYRFVTMGTMEMKIYERQVTKQAISKRVIDEQQIDRHYNQNDLAELYKFDPKPDDRPTPLVPKDVLLGELLQKFEDRIYKYHEHQSLLENKEEEGLNEEERKAAWEEFENEKKQRSNMGVGNFMRSPNVEIALANIVRKENPTWNETQIKAMIPALHAQLQEQVSKGELTLYRRVQQEIQILHALQSQRIKEQFYQQQALRMYQQQHITQQMAAAMKFQNGAGWLDQYVNNPNQMPGGSTTNATNSGLNPHDIIDLND